MIGWGIAIVLGLIATAFFALFLSRRIEHGEARFDSAGRMVREDERKPSGPATPATRHADSNRSEVS